MADRRDDAHTTAGQGGTDDELDEGALEAVTGGLPSVANDGNIAPHVMPPQFELDPTGSIGKAEIE